VQEPQGSSAFEVRLSRKAQKLCGEVEKRVQGSQDPGAFGSVALWSLKNFMARSDGDARIARFMRSRFGRIAEIRTPGTVEGSARAARFKCFRSSIEPQGLKTLRRGRKEGARVARLRCFRSGSVMEPKKLHGEIGEGAGIARFRCSRFGRVAQTTLHGAVG